MHRRLARRTAWIRLTLVYFNNTALCLHGQGRDQEVSPQARPAHTRRVPHPGVLAAKVRGFGSLRSQIER